MFQLTEKPPHIWWPATVNQPSGDKPGEIDKKELKLLFEAIGRGEMEEVERAMNKAELAGDKDAVDAMLVRVVKDWRDVVDDAQSPIPFSEERLRAALQISWVRIGFLRAWTAFVSGDPRLGN